MNLKDFRIVIALCIVVATLTSASLTFAQDQAGVEATVAPDYLFVRQGPSTTTPQVGSVTLGTTLVVTGRENNPNDEGSWVFVTQKGGGISGWVLVTYLFFPENYNIGVLPVVSASGNTTANAPVSSTTSTTTTTTNTQTTTTSAIPNGISGVTKDFVNLRTGPELTFSVIRQLRPNEEIVFVGRNSNGVWLQVVTTKDEVGWVFYQLVTLSGDRNNLPVVGANNVPVTTTTGSTTTTTTTSGDTAQAPSSLNAQNVNLGLKPGSDPSNDGRLNPNIELGFIIAYCVDRNGYTNAGTFAGGGIALYRFSGDTGVVFFASEAEINAVGSNPTGGRLIKADNSFSLGRTENGEFLLAGPDARGGPFTFLWRDCGVGRRVQ